MLHLCRNLEAGISTKMFLSIIVNYSIEVSKLNGKIRVRVAKVTMAIHNFCITKSSPCWDQDLSADAWVVTI
jgi:hypothetical protein